MSRERKPLGPIRDLDFTHRPIRSEERKTRGVVWCGRCRRLLWVHRPLTKGITTDVGKAPCRPLH